MLRRRASAPSLSFPGTQEEVTVQPIVVNRRHSVGSMIAFTPDDSLPVVSSKQKEFALRKQLAGMPRSYSDLKLPGMVVMDEQKALACGVLQEELARTALTKAMAGQDAGMLAEAIVRAKGAGVDDSKLEKAEVVHKRLRAAEMRKQLHASFMGKPTSPALISESLESTGMCLTRPQTHESTIRKKPLMSAFLEEPIQPQRAAPRDIHTGFAAKMRAQAMIAGMEDAWASPRQNPCLRRGIMKRVKRASLSEIESGN
jgi:hypothetical protein